MSEFILKATPSGSMTCFHKLHGALVHSAQDPAIEAEVAASMIARERNMPVLLIGNGLGYLSRALDSRGALYRSLELFDELESLAKNTTGCPAHQTIVSAQDLQTVVESAPQNVYVVIAPYILSLRQSLTRELADYVGELHVTLQSQQHYRLLIEDNVRRNQANSLEVPVLLAKSFESDLIAMAVGSGPTLEVSMNAILEHREKLLLVAASGAVPILREYGVDPDWIVAMEARDTIERDMECVSEASKVLVFQWTHPSVFQNKKLTRIMALDEHGIMTGGGATGLAAADLATKLTTGAVYLLGMEMSNYGGAYSLGAARESTDLLIDAPKFQVMRKSAASWVASMPSRKVYHMIMPGDKALHGVTTLYPIELGTSLVRERYLSQNIVEVAQ